MRVRAAWAMTKNAANGFIDHQVMTLSAALSFYTVLSMPALMALAIGVAAIFSSQSEAVHGLEVQLQQQLPPGVSGVLMAAVENASRYISNRWTLAVGIAVLAAAATTIFVQLQGSLNTIWQVRAKPTAAVLSFIRARALSFLMVLAVGMLLLGSMVLTAVLEFFYERLARLDAGTYHWWQYTQLGVSVVAAAVLFAVIYVLLPDVRVPWRAAWPVAVVTSVLFAAGRWLMDLYLEHTMISTAFGAAGSIIVILLWVYYSSIILLGGAELVRAYADHLGLHTQPSRHAVRVNCA